MTIKELIESSLRLISVLQPGETATPDDLAVSQEALKDLIDNLANSQLNTYTITPHRFPIVPGQQTYSLGPELDEAGNPTGADWVTERPVRIDNIKLLMYPLVSSGPPTPSEYFFTYSARMTADTIQYAAVYEAEHASVPATGIWDTGSESVPPLTVFPTETLVVIVEGSNLSVRTNVPLETSTYWEIEIGIPIDGASEYAVGVFAPGPFNVPFNPTYTAGSNPAYGTYYTSGGFILGSNDVFPTYTQGDVIGVLYNGNNKATFFKNGTLVHHINMDVDGNPVYPIAGAYTPI